MRFLRFASLSLIAVLGWGWTSAYADITLETPKEGEVVETTPKAMRDFLDMDMDQRRTFFSDENHRSELQRAREPDLYPFTWKISDAQPASCALEISTDKDFSVLSPVYISEITHKDGVYEAGVANFLLGQTYYWRVKYTDKEGSVKTSDVQSFVSDSRPPRLIYLKKNHSQNVRDMGGWTGLDGRKVRQGILYRSAGLNKNHPEAWDINKKLKASEKVDMSSFEPQPTFFSEETIAYLTNGLKWKTDVDLRSEGEVAGLKGSPLGDKVQWEHHALAGFKNILGNKYDGSGPRAKVVADIFRVLIKQDNYPVDFHCIGGRDRAGTLAFILNGVLGVNVDDLYRDWETSGGNGYPHTSMDTLRDGLMQHFGQPEDPLHRKIEIYLNQIGISDDEIAQFRTIMLEPKKSE